MHRRKFIKTICVASTISTSLLVGCKSTPVLVKGLIKDNKLYIPLAEFELRNTVSVAFENSAIGVTQFNEHEFVAVLLKCTHKGCTVSSSKSNDQAGFICPCHGAKFTSNGVVIKGPAEKNLTQYVTSSDNEFVIIHL